MNKCNFINSIIFIILLLFLFFIAAAFLMSVFVGIPAGAVGAI